MNCCLYCGYWGNDLLTNISEVIPKNCLASFLGSSVPLKLFYRKSTINMKWIVFLKGYFWIHVILFYDTYIGYNLCFFNKIEVKIGQIEKLFWDLGRRNSSMWPQYSVKISMWHSWCPYNHTIITPTWSAIPFVSYFQKLDLSHATRRQLHLVFWYLSVCNIFWFVTSFQMLCLK